MYDTRCYINVRTTQSGLDGCLFTAFVKLTTFSVVVVVVVVVAAAAAGCIISPHRRMQCWMLAIPMQSCVLVSTDRMLGQMALSRSRCRLGALG